MILILDDHPLARQGLESIIKMYRPEKTVVQAGNVEEAIEQMSRRKADMAFVDVNLGKESGFAFVEWVKKEANDTKIFFITSSSRESDFQYAQKMDADAYVLKDAFIDDIIYGLKVVERGEKFYSPALMEKICRSSEDERLLKELTERELDVLVLLSQGYSNSKISDTLFISEGTTKKHITNILGKLGFESRSEAMLFANTNSYIIRTAIQRSVKEDRRRGNVWRNMV